MPPTGWAPSTTAGRRAELNNAPYQGRKVQCRVARASARGADSQRRHDQRQMRVWRPLPTGALDLMHGRATGARKYGRTTGDRLETAASRPNPEGFKTAAFDHSATPPGASEGPEVRSDPLRLPQNHC